MALKDQPIGIFDSGIGGLSVAHAIKKQLPKERIIYFGDTAHLPYGEKSEAAIQAYSIKISDILLKRGCKVIVIACNSASSAAYDLLKEYVGSRATIVNVIDPMIQYVLTHYKYCKVGLIGTNRTIDSNVYASKLDQAGTIDLFSLATPLLVPMIEEGFYNNRISDDIIKEYLKNSRLDNIKALILGCTHYPLIKTQIDAYFGGGVDILDSSNIVATFLKDHLNQNDLLADNGDPKDEFLVSDFTSSFEATAAIFFKKEIRLHKYPLWN